MADRTVAATAEIATLRQKLAAAEARIQEMSRLNATEADKPFASWKSRSTIYVNAWLHLFAICRGRDPVEG
jgi:hypothetical protein